MTYKINSDRTAAVSLGAVWLPIDEYTPRGVRLLLINRHAGVAQISHHQPADAHYTHWHPMPRFAKD